MNWSHKIQSGFRALFRKEKLDDEMDDEMRFHLEQQRRENIEAGMPPEDAHYAALRSFGGMEQIKEICRDLRGVSWIETFWQDVRYGLRILAKQPFVALVGIGVLGLGIAGTTTVFALYNGVFLRPFGVAVELITQTATPIGLEVLIPDAHKAVLAALKKIPPRK